MVRRVLDMLQEVTHVSSRMSEFESYYVSLQRVSALSGGPTADEAKADYRAAHRSPWNTSS